MLAGMLAHQHLPHALLINGAAGTGRRALALWLAGRMLGFGVTQDSAQGRAGLGPETALLHPDLMLLQPEPDKYGIGVDQVRRLIDLMHLTSHQKGSKIAVICPAQALSISAANALLKTLEEPPPGSLLVLISDLPSQLPPTIVSRCQQLRVTVPPRAVALGWLQAQRRGIDWEAPLEFSGGAPLKALELADAGFAEHAQQLEQDIRDLLSRRQTPAAVGGKWARTDIDLCLRWLYGRTGRMIRSLMSGAMAESGSDAEDMRLQNGVKTLNMHALFAYLEELAESRRLNSTSLNKALKLNNLLMWWYGGFSAP